MLFPDVFLKKEEHIWDSLMEQESNQDKSKGPQVFQLDKMRIDCNEASDKSADRSFLLNREGSYGCGTHGGSRAVERTILDELPRYGVVQRAYENSKLFRRYLVDGIFYYP